MENRRINYCPNNGQIFGVKQNSFDINNSFRLYDNINGLTQDVFQPNINLEEITRTKFETLFSKKEFDNIYDKINKDFGIENPPDISFVYDSKSERGGGYSFRNNKIEMNLYDLMTSNKKLVGIKDGQKTTLYTPSEKLPYFMNEQNAEKAAGMYNKNGSLGFDRLIVEDVTPEEQRKFIIQKIAHECVHAKQHEILRQTEGIGDKEILKAWTHKKPKNLIEKFILNYNINKMYKNTPWINKPAEVKYTKDSRIGKYAQTLMDAIRNYPPVTSLEYKNNALEKEAFDISFKYVNSNNF